ncbi:MAG: hypothetical protein LBH98_00525 [Chitinispirillales bacterium]|nr:hypothetical protein [Chitinispirillales bacterium]
MPWDKEKIERFVWNYENYDISQQAKIEKYLRENVSFEEFCKQRRQKTKAIENGIAAKNILLGARQKYPQRIDYSQISVNLQDIKKYAVLIMAGGEGERLRLSLEERGYSKDDLRDFTKATFPIPNTKFKFGALEVNLKTIAELSKSINYEIPTIITTGPKNSDTDEIIPKILSENANFGVKNIEIIAQNERFHLTCDDKIVFEINGSEIKPVKNPDETGGPIAKLKEPQKNGKSILENLEKNGIKKIIVLQGTAVYSKRILPVIAAAGLNYDGLGIGILRENFPEYDPYGTFVSVKNDGDFNLRIVEKNMRTCDTYKVKDENGKFLPYNTGFYVFDIDLLKNVEMSDYATPPKIILEGIDLSSKIGFAATDIISFAKKPAVLTISNDDFHVIKNVEDLNVLTEIITKFGL